MLNSNVAKQTSNDYLKFMSDFTLHIQEETDMPGSGTQSEPSNALPPDHEDAKKWFYRDPQGDLQGDCFCVLFNLFMLLECQC